MSDRNEARLRRTVEIAQALGALREPAVVAWFDRTERNQIDCLLAATDDDKRRELAAMANAIRELKRFVYGAVEAGDRAIADLDKLRA